MDKRAAISAQLPFHQGVTYPRRWSAMYDHQERMLVEHAMLFKGVNSI